MTNKGGPGKAAYDKAYESSPAQVKKREMRNEARAVFEKKNGNLPSNVDVDHKVPLGVTTKGANKPGNLRAKTQLENRGWRAGESSHKAKTVK